MKTKEWIHNFNNMGPNQQMIIAKALVEELKNNESYLDIESEYNNKMSQSIRLFFNRMIEVSSSDYELKKLQATLERFQSLSPKRQSEVIKSLVSSINNYYKEQDHEEKENICKSEGHIMGDWTYRSWTTYEDTVIDHQQVHGLECPHQEWERKCARCGFQERTTIEPEELRVKREEKEIQGRIKELEKELKMLKRK